MILAVAMVAGPAVVGSQRSSASACSIGATSCNIAYVAGGANRNQVLDVFAPGRRSAGRTPVVIFLHGGGWWGGDKTTLANRDFNAPLAAARRGWVAFNVNYRLADDPGRPGPGDTAAGYRDQRADVASAVRWVQANAARYGGNPHRIAVVGASAGAHLALLVGYTVPGIRAVVSWAGPTDLTTLAAVNPCVAGPDGACVAGGYPMLSEMLRRMAACTLAQCPGRYHDLSPVAHALPGVPATLQIRGAVDTTVPAEQAGELDRALRAAGVVSVVTDCVVVPGATPLPCTHDTIAAAVWAPTEAFLAARL